MGQISWQQWKVFFERMLFSNRFESVAKQPCSVAPQWEISILLKVIEDKRSRFVF